MSSGERAGQMTLRVAGALCVLAIGAVHVDENVAQHYDAIPVIGVLFWLNAASALAIGLTLLVPLTWFRPARWGGPARVAAAGGGILLAAGSIAGLLVSEHTTLFGFHESGYRGVIVVALALEVAAIALLGVYLATGAAPNYVRRKAPGVLPAPAVALSAILVGVLLAGGAWAIWLRGGGAGDRSVPASGASASALAAGGAGQVVSTSSSGALGTFLADAHGRPLYLFRADRRASGTSTCSGACAALWPPLRTSGLPKAVHGALGSRLSVLRRSDGGAQVAYDGWPLYTYAADRPGGPPLGQGLDQFGGKWFVLSPSAMTLTGRA